MPLKVPLTYNSEKIKRINKKLIKVSIFFLWVFWIGLIIYLGYKYYSTKDVFYIFMVILFIWLSINWIREDYFKNKKTK